MPLSSADFLRILECSNALTAITELDELPQKLLEILGTIIDADRHGLSELDLEARHLTVFETNTTPSSIIEGLLHHVHQHPLYEPLRRRRLVRARRLSDFMSATQLRELPLYHHFFQPLHTRYHLPFTVSIDGAVTRLLSFGRESRDFSRDDCETLDLLRVPIERAFRNAQLISELRLASRDPLSCADERAVGLVVVDDARRVVMITERARELLTAYLGGLPACSQSLPEPIATWMKRSRAAILAAAEPLHIEGAGGSLSVRLAHCNGAAIIVLEEAVSARVRVAHFQRIGLTPRQAEVMSWVDEGKLDADIGVIMGISTRTVQKHLENVFCKLGASSRTEALTIARSKLRQAALAR